MIKERPLSEKEVEQRKMLDEHFAGRERLSHDIDISNFGCPMLNEELGDKEMEG